MTDYGQSFDLKVWPDGAPGGLAGLAESPELGPELWRDVQVVRNVSEPTLSAFLPNPLIATGAAAIVCPGGGFHFHSIYKEGVDVATWLRDRGIAAFLLTYRLVPTSVDPAEFLKETDSFRERGHLMERIVPLAVADGQEALRIVRHRADEWRLDPNRCGLVGFSAGGIVTSGVALADDAETRPSFAGVIYGAPMHAITVPVGAPPLFLLVANDDTWAAANSLAMYQAWTAAGKSVEYHIYSTGGHGFGMQPQGLPSDHWIERFHDWLAVQGIVAKSKA